MLNFYIFLRAILPQFKAVKLQNIKVKNIGEDVSKFQENSEPSS